MRTLERILRIGLVAGLLGAAGCYASTYGYGTYGYSSGYSTYGVVAVSTPPPAPVDVYFDARPGYVWVQGRWVYSGSQWIWQQGYWESARAGHVYVDGYWDYRGSQYVWIDGYWAPERPGYTYISGYWEPRGSSYGWVHGRWEASRPGHTYVRGYWRNDGGRRSWQQGYWASASGSVSGSVGRPLEVDHTRSGYERGRTVVPARPSYDDRRAPPVRGYDRGGRSRTVDHRR